ncbi:basic secretory protein-like protein [Rubritalea tangerina]|uniref:Basic secretory protein-like protein n=2 Tax=Rubritalea tangerina TaxID=430798 RepID=A0ABW4Z8V8_9BACT
MKNVHQHTLSIAILASTALGAHAIEPTNHHTTLPTYKEHTRTLATDGLPDTHFWSDRNPRRGDIFQVDFAQSLKGKNVFVHSGQANGRDQIHNANLQVSADGKQWKTIGRFRQGKAQGKVTFDATKARIAFYGDGWSWVVIREIKISSDPLTLISKEKTINYGDKKIPLKITVDIDGAQSQQKVIDDLIERYFIEWPMIAKLLDAPLPTTPKHLYLCFYSKMGHPAHVSGTTMVISTNHLKNHTKDTYGVFTHELTHFVQNYRGKAPTWFSEGTADYIRYMLHTESLWARRNLKHQNRKNPLGSYWSSTAFLIWLEKTYKKPITAKVSCACSDGKYNDAIWQQLTGKSLEELTKLYQAEN